MNPFQLFAQNMYQNVTAWIDQRSKARPAQLAVNLRPPNIVINHDAFRHHWRENMNFHEGRAWDAYWQLPGRDYQQADIAEAGPDWDPDIDEDFDYVGDGVDARLVASATVDVAGELIHDGCRVKDAWQADRLGQANTRQEVDPATNVEHSDQDDDTDRDSGYSTATPSSLHKQQASTLALPEHDGVQKTSSPDSVDPLDPIKPAHKPSALPVNSDQDAATTSAGTRDSSPSVSISSPSVSMNAVSTIAMRTFTRTRTPTAFRHTLPRNAGILTLASNKPRTITTSAHVKSAFRRSAKDTLDQDAGNYLTGASTLVYGDAFFLLVGGIIAVWIAGKVGDEVKDVVWPKVKWMERKVAGEENGKGK